MAAVDFPNSPTVGQTFVSGTRAWSWDGVSWNLLVSVSPAMYSMGLEADRPTGSAGMQYFATNTSRLFLHDGTGWIVMSEPLQTYTPTLANVTPGTGVVNTGEFQRSGGWCDLFVFLRLGTAGALTGQPTMTFPPGITPAVIQRYQLAVQLTQSGVNDYRGVTQYCSAGATTLTPFAINGTNPLENAQVLTATVPWTWTTNSTIQIAGRFRMNSKYM